MLAGGCPPPAQEPVLPPYPLNHTAVPPFVVGIEADRTSGTPGTKFLFTAQSTAAGVTFSWRTDDGTTADGASADFSFSTPGLKGIHLTGIDGAGRTAKAVMSVMVFDPAATAPTITPGVIPSSGIPGTLIQIFSNSLLDPAANVLIDVDSLISIQPFRPALGQANTIIPTSLTAGLTAPRTIKVRVKSGPQTLDEFNFQLNPPAPFSGPPGAHTRSAFQAMRKQAQSMAASVTDAVAFADPSSEEQAVLLGMAKIAAANLVAITDAIGPLLDQLDADTLARLDLLLAANGITEDFLKNAPMRVKSPRAARLVGDEIIDFCCIFHEAATLVDTVGNAMEVAAPFIAIGALAAGPAGATAAAVANACISAGIASDIAALLRKIVPTVEDSLIVSVSPNTILSGQSATVELRARLKLEYDPCADLLDKLLGELAKIAAKKILGKVSTNGVLADAIRRSKYYDGFQDEVMQGFSDYVENVVSALANSVMKLSGINNTFKQFTGKFCNLKDRFTPQIQASPELLSTDPVFAGTFTASEDNAKFTCAGTHPFLTIKARRRCGVTKVLTGDVAVHCQGICEDGLAFLGPNPAGLEGNCDFGNCYFNRPFNLTNTHPSRILIVMIQEDTENGGSGQHSYGVDTRTLHPGQTIGTFYLSQCWISNSGQVALKGTHIIQAFLACDVASTDPACVDRFGIPQEIADCKQQLINNWLNNHVPYPDYSKLEFPPCAP